MRFIHTADWHLGRAFYGTHLTDDQAHTLEGLHDLVAEVRPDAVLIAGDVYDRAVPPPEAVTLLDETLTRLAERTRVIVIAGNHDDPRRLGFGSRLLERAGVVVAGSLTHAPPSVVLESGSQRVRVTAVPYADPAEVRAVFGDEELRGHEAALAAVLDRARGLADAGERHVIVGHAFVTGGCVSESERPLSVGGSGEVALGLFDGFDYVALGHLHAPQRVGSEHVRYSGSLMKYSFDEWRHTKSVSVVELAEDGALRLEEATLPVRRDVRKVAGTMDELLASAPKDATRDDYIWADLLDSGPVYDPIERLREVYPNVMYAARTAAAIESEISGPTTEEIRRLGVPELFERFFADATGEEMPDAARDELLSLLTKRESERREAGL